MRRYWKIAQQTFEAYSQRERMTITFGCSLALMLILLFTLWIPKVESLIEIVNKQESAAKQEQASKEAIIQLENRSKQDINAPYRKELDQLETQISEQEANIEDLTASLILPNRMPLVFSQLLDEQHLKIIDLTNVAAKPIQIDEGKTNTSVLFKHSLKMTLEGQYLNSLQYIKKIESQPWKLYWETLEFDMATYPNGVLKLNVYSISTSEHVLGL